MTSPLMSGNRWLVLGVAVFGLGCIALAADEAPAMALINESPSLPKGLYIRLSGADPAPGAIVAFRQPQSARAYLSSLGMPHTVFLLKRVVAGAGDTVCQSDDGVRTAALWHPVQATDRKGRPLPHWDECRGLGEGELFVLGDTLDSFDSRYFGPVTIDQIEGVFGEVVSW